MYKVYRRFVLLLFFLLLVSCKKTLSPEQTPAHIVVGDHYFTQFVVRYEKGVHLTSNYRRGEVIPVNTKVRLVEITSKTIKVELINSATPLLIKNIQKHTGDDIFQAFDKLFAAKKVNLSKFTGKERKHIKAGTVAKGMRKKAVIVAIGYPPITETPNLEADAWMYWSSRYNKFRVNFKSGRVFSIVD